MARILVISGGTVVAALTAFAVLTTPLSALVSISMVTTILVATFATLIEEAALPGTERTDRGLQVGVAAGLSMTPLIGLAVILGDATGPVFALLAAVAAAVCAHRRWASTAPQPAWPAVSQLSTNELCRQWRHSYILLQQARDAESAEQIATFRRCCLDELQVRQPAGFARWLDAEAGPDSDPAQFIASGPDEDGDDGPMEVAGR